MKPILFSTPMVLAVMNGTKTETRRLTGLEKINENPDDWDFSGGPYVHNCNKPNEKQYMQFYHKPSGRPQAITIPYGYNENRDCLLWLREAWKVAGWDFDSCEMLIEYKDVHKEWNDVYDPSEDMQWLLDYVEKMEDKGVIKMPETNPPGVEDDEVTYEVIGEFPWKPSIHMPKEACRTFLKITNVSIERLHEISDEDAIAEGLKVIDYKGTSYAFDDSGRTFASPRGCFRALWEKINGKESWRQSPWVWVVRFEKIEKPADWPDTK